MHARPFCHELREVQCAVPSALEADDHQPPAVGEDINVAMQVGGSHVVQYYVRPVTSCAGSDFGHEVRFVVVDKNVGTKALAGIELFR